MIHRRNGLVSAAILAFVLSAAACAHDVAATPASTPSPVPAGVLLTVESRGGLCPGGTCGTTIFLERDGRVHVAAKPPNDLGVVQPAELAALEEAIQTTDFAELRSHRFTGECPTAYDGQELIFEFGAPTGVERIAACEIAIDYSSALFVAVANAVGTFISLPIPSP